MNRGRSIFAQLLDFVPFSHFEHLVDRYASNHGIQHFSAWTPFLCIAYSQLTRREGLRDLVACLNSQRTKLYHIGIRAKDNMRYSRAAWREVDKSTGLRSDQSLLLTTQNRSGPTRIACVGFPVAIPKQTSSLCS